MTESYSNALIKFVLTHYIEIMYGKITVEEMQDFCSGTAGKNPLETALQWKADTDRALVALAPTMKGWQSRDIASSDIIIQICRSKEISRMQRCVINDCILKECSKMCKETGYGKSKLCYNEGIITRMRHFLNGEQRDADGKFTVKLTSRSKA